MEMKLTDIQIDFIKKSLEALGMEPDVDLHADVTDQQLEAIRIKLYSANKTWGGAKADYTSDSPLFVLVFLAAADAVRERHWRSMCDWETIITNNPVAIEMFTFKFDECEMRGRVLFELVQTFGIDPEVYEQESDRALAHMWREFSNRNPEWDVDGMNAYLKERNSSGQPG